MSHPNYPHAGSGPSSYYQQPPPPPPHVYGTHSPVPRPNYYPYPGPPPPHMNAHQPPQYHQPGPSRGTPRGHYGSRGTHNYHNYQQPHPQQHQQPHFIPHSHVNPALVHPQHSSQQMYSPQLAKYNQPFTPSYSYPSPTAPVFTPSWQTQQAISPLPKQLSMPQQPFQEPPPAPAPVEDVSAPLTTAVDTPTEPTENLEIPTEETQASSSPSPSPSPSSPATPSPDTPSIPEPTVLPQMSSSYAQMGTISTSEPPSPSLSRSASPPARKAPVWTIWSRRPQDPSHAPGIIISPRARPPPDIVQQALDLKTPPPSPPSSPGPAIASIKSLPSVALDSEDAGSTIAKVDEAGIKAWVSQTNSSVPSSAVTESADTTPTVPGSPASSHTSLSVGVGNSQGQQQTKEYKSVPAQSVDVIDEKPVLSDSAELEVPEALSTQSTTTPARSELGEVKVEETPSSEMLAAPQPVSPAPAPAAPAGVASTPTTTTTNTSTPASTPAPAPAAAPAPAPKKLWASLLRPTSSPSTPGGGAPQRNALPTSSIVGFSIPAVASTPTTTNANGTSVTVSATKKSELVSLLTTGPASPTAAAVAAGASSGTALKIRPRGLVNSGNMCFANSVLQVLVYCPPFHRLFVELGKVLVGPVVGSNSNSNSKDSAEKNANASATPLVDATVEFLKEFVEDKRRKDKAKLEVVNRSGSSNSYSGNNNNGAGSGGSKGAKGKEREREVVQQEEEDDWDGESFLPTYIYDAMKAKKRFDNMRGGHQEDAEEFFGFYLDTLEEELLSILNSVNPPPKTNPNNSAAAKNAMEEKEEAAPPEDDGWLEVGKRNRMVVTRTIKATESPITRIFGGKFRSTLRASGQKDSVVVEDWRSLRLDIQRDQIHTIEDALSYISHPQPVQLTQSARPGVTIEAHQQVLIEALPPILVLHIKRFCYDTAVNGVVKVGKQVRFGPELVIGADVMVPAAKKTQPARYKLFGALYHHGLSASGGHYTLDVLHPNRYPNVNPNAKPREGWVRIDDDLVSDVRPEDVFGATEKDDARCAYLLFYRRI